MIASHRFAVLQLGARMNYAAPAFLASAGMLEALYTDTHAGTPTARVIRALIPPALRPRAVRRLLGRRLPVQINTAQVHTANLAALSAALTGGSAEEAVRHCAMESGFRNANALYAVSHGDVDIVVEAHRRGMFIVFEQVLAPAHIDLMAEERRRFPGIEAPATEEDEAFYVDAHRTIWACADVILSPSEFVTESIAAVGGPVAKVAHVPYGIPEALLDAEPDPVPGRVLFVGQVGLRKGSAYLAGAARLLRERRVPCEVRVVGEVPPAVLRDSLFCGPDYAGQVPRAEVQREFLSADVFVLPSLAEGSATAHLEALAAGLPVIATPNAGCVIRHGEDGLIVPVRDARALADAIEQVITDRTLRYRMSARSRQRAAEHTWPLYRERFLNALAPVAAPALT